MQNNCSIKEQYAIDDKVQEKVRVLYEKVGTTPSKHIGFYTQNVEEAKAYYDSNETLKSKYVTLIDLIETVNTQLKVIMEENNETSI